MSRPILVGYDPRAGDRAPIQFGVAAARFTGAPLVVASVQAGPPVVPVAAGTNTLYAVGQVDADLVADCTGPLEEVEADLRASGIEANCRKLQGTSAAGALHRHAEEIDAGLLVVGSTRRSAVGQVMPGSTAERLLHGAPCPVAVVPQGWTDRGVPKTIGVAYVDTEEGRQALRAAHALARRAGATLRALTVVKVTLGMYDETEPSTSIRPAKVIEDVEGEHRVLAERALREAVEPLADDVHVEVDAFVGDPAEVLVDLSQNLDLLVCGSRGYGPLRAVLLGSVTRRVTAEARCPVIVVPRGVRNALEAMLEPAGAATPAA
jgi:nucleotide-binding universal stress UspA family protein